MWTSVSWFSDQRTAQVDLRSGRGSAPEAGGLLPRRHVRVSREQRGSSVLLSHGGGMQDCKSNPFDDCRERSRLQGFKVKLFHCLQVLLSISSCAVPSISAVGFKLRPLDMAGEAGDARGLAWTGILLIIGFGAVGTSQHCPPRHPTARRCSCASWKKYSLVRESRPSLKSFESSHW
jgi:hypothetical protein